MQVRPDELREAARYLRYLGSDLDYIHWRIQMAWARLDKGLELGCEIAHRGYEWVGTALADAGESLYHYAWVLEATACWVEEADRQAAVGFMVIEHTWGIGGAEIGWIGSK